MLRCRLRRCVFKVWNAVTIERLDKFFYLLSRLYFSIWQRLYSAVKNFFNFKHFKSDLFGGITAGIVALPLALAFGEQSGLGAAAGLYGAAFIAFFAALFGGTSTQISGPTAPMTALSMVAIAGIIQANEGNVEKALPTILVVFLLAGVLQIVLGMLKWGTFIKFIPYTVVSGFMTGIGVIILITQVLPAMGYYPGADKEIIEQMKPQAEELILERILREQAEDDVLVMEEYRQTISLVETVSEKDILIEATTIAGGESKGVLGALTYFPRALSRINWLELGLCLLTIFIIYGFRKITKAVPSTLVALGLVTLGAYFMEVDYVKIQEIPSGLPILHLEMFTDFKLGSVTPYLLTALMLALLGAIDSLLTSVVADNMTRTRHNPNRELMGQGIGNSIASLFGGLPGAGATIRTVVNIQAGGKTKISGMTAGLLLFAILLVLGPVASAIPAAVLAGILITVGIGVMDYKGLKALPRMETAEKAILITVLLLTVFWQLVYAVAVGLVMASVIFLKRMSDISSNQSEVSNLTSVANDSGDPLWADEIEIPDEIRDKVYFKHIDGPLFFGFVTGFRDLVSELPDINLLVIRMKMVPFIDQSGVYALEAAIEDLQESGVVVAISGLNETSAIMLRKMKVVPQLIPERLVFHDFTDCSKWLLEVMGKEGSLKEELKLLEEKK